MLSGVAGAKLALVACHGGSHAYCSASSCKKQHMRSDPHGKNVIAIVQPRNVLPSAPRVGAPH